jgi:hypothetical protein
MNAEDVANFMADDEAELPHNPHYNGNDNNAPAPVSHAPRNAPPKAPSKGGKAPAKGPPPVKAKAAPGLVRPAPPPTDKEEMTAEDIRNMLLRGGGGGGAEEQEETSVRRKSPRRFEPLASDIESRSSERRGAQGGGFASVVVTGTEERAETLEEQARTFVAYRLEVRREEGGPYVVYRRYKQFEQLWARCRSHGMAVRDLPPRRPGNWFGLKAVDPAVVAERVPRLQEWFEHALSLGGAVTCKFLQEWLSPVQLGDISAKNYAKMIGK